MQESLSAEGGLIELEQIATRVCEGSPFMVGKHSESRGAVVFRPR